MTLGAGYAITYDHSGMPPLLTAVICSVVALALTAVIELSGNRARRTARANYVARYGEDPGGRRS